MKTYQEIIEFWFEEISPESWWKKDLDFDVLIKNRFSNIHSMATKNELSAWRETPKGRLAEIIVLDQFSRNIHRNTPLSFASDSQALTLSQEAIRTNAQHELNTNEKLFLYLPFMHSESLEIHKKALDLFSEKGLEDNLDFEKKHMAIIERFGRYPHRNEILGRNSTDEEIEFLKTPGSSF